MNLVLFRLQINETKSECLYVGNEIEPGENIAGIPFVESLKVLGFFLVIQK